MLSKLPKRIQDKIEVQENECWYWKGYIASNGYGRVHFEGRKGALAHRVVRHIIREDIEVDATPETILDHKPFCGIKHCVNPYHTKSGTSRDNTLTGNSPNIISHLTKICKNGHDISIKSNLVKSAVGNRCCICANSTSKAFYEDNKEDQNRKAMVRYYKRKGEEMPDLSKLGSLLNEDGTVGVQNDVKGDIINTYELGKSTIYHVTKFCPSCPKGVEQPTNHVVISRGLNNVSYMCDVCGSHYYYLKSEVWGFIPEAQMKYYGLPNYEKKVNRKPYELHYLEARECRWYEVIDLNDTTITPGIWTAVTELSGQIFHKNIDGYAPGRLLGQFLKNEEEIPLSEELGPQMQQAMAWLKQMEFI